METLKMVSLHVKNLNIYLIINGFGQKNLMEQILEFMQIGQSNMEYIHLK